MRCNGVWFLPFAGLVIGGRFQFRECREVIVVEIPCFGKNFTEGGPSIALDRCDRSDCIAVEHVEPVNVMRRPMGMWAIIPEDVALSIQPCIVGIRLRLDERIGAYWSHNSEFLPDAEGNSPEALDVASKQESTVSVWREYGAISGDESLSHELHHDGIVNRDVVGEPVWPVSARHRSLPLTLSQNSHSAIAAVS